MSSYSTSLVQAGRFDRGGELLQSNPDWYFKSTDWEYWVSNFFNTPVEIHTFQLGLLVGILFGLLAARHFPKTSVAVLLVLIGFLFGAFDLPILCAQRTESCAHVRLKPWYFLTGVVLSQFSVLAVTNRLGALAPTTLTNVFHSEDR